MNREQQVQNLRRRNRLAWGILLVLTALLSIVVWEAFIDRVPTAQAQGRLDAGAQRSAMIQQQKQTNKLLGDMITLLKSGKIKVEVVESKTKPKPKGK